MITLLLDKMVSQDFYKLYVYVIKKFIVLYQD